MSLISKFRQLLKSEAAPSDDQSALALEFVSLGDIETAVKVRKKKIAGILDPAFENGGTVPFVETKLDTDGEPIEVPLELAKNGGYNKTLQQRAYRTVRAIQKALADGVSVGILEEVFPAPTVLAEVLVDNLNDGKVLKDEDAAETLLYSHASNGLKNALNSLRVNIEVPKTRNDSVKKRKRK